VMLFLAYGGPISCFLIGLSKLAIAPTSRVIAAWIMIVSSSAYFGQFLLSRVKGRDAVFFYARVTGDNIVSIYNPIDWVATGISIALPTLVVFEFFVR